MKTMLMILIASMAIFAQENYSGYGDTVLVTGFQGTGTGTTRAFELSKYENIIFQACANDTSAIGYASDSIVFRWGIERGDVLKNTSNRPDTTWQERYLVDTFDIRTAANMVRPVLTADTLGNFAVSRKFIDSVNVTGWAVQDRDPGYIPWSPIFRFWYTGLAGNKVSSSYVKLMFGQSRRLYSKVRNE